MSSLCSLGHAVASTIHKVYEGCGAGMHHLEYGNKYLTQCYSHRLSDHGASLDVRGL